MNLFDQVISLVFNLFESILLLVVFRRAGFSKAWLIVPFVPVMLWLFWFVFRTGIEPQLDSESLFATQGFFVFMRIFWQAPLLVLVLARWPKLGGTS